MLKILISIVLAFITTTAFATSIKSSTTVTMTDQEIQLAIQLANKYEGSTVINSPCTITSFEIASRVRGFNPARWTIENSEGISNLESEEIPGMIDLVNRVEPSLIRINSITSETRVYIQGKSCGFTPNKWTVTFN